LGIRIPAQVSYASIGFHLRQLGMAYDGTGRLLSNILSLAHLWNEVRVQGGAYGAGMRLGMGGGMMTYSYRDPSPARSLEVYRNMGNFVRNFAASGEDITGFIISTVSDTEPLASPDQLGAGADRDWFSGFSREHAVAERQQLLSATTAELSKWCQALDALREHSSVCVVGFADALAACESENLTVIDI
jgi:Zn-dependent M16 (insulinase) family peptidase